MGYRIDYQPVRKIRGSEKRHSRILAATGGFFLLFLLLTHCFWPEGMSALRELLIPGDAAYTAAAAEALCRDLKEDAPIAEALAVFCQRLLQDRH